MDLSCLGACVWLRGWTIKRPLVMTEAKRSAMHWQTQGQLLDLRNMLWHRRLQPRILLCRPQSVLEDFMVVLHELARELYSYMRLREKRFSLHIQECQYYAVILRTRFTLAASNTNPLLGFFSGSRDICITHCINQGF